MPDNAPYNALRYHVSGAIARGEAEPIVAVEMPRNWRRWSDAHIEGYIAALNASDDDSVLSVIDDMQEELDEREEYRDNHADTPSLQDEGRELGSYGL